MSSRSVAVLAIAVMLCGCTRSIPEAAPTTTSAPITTRAATTTTAASTTTTTLPPIAVGGLPEYQILLREPLEGSGDRVVVLLDPGSYQSLTDIDLYDVIVDVVERFPPVHEAHLIDSAAALEGVLAAAPTPEQAAAAELHYLARLEGGIRIVYLGPFAAEGSTVLGS